MSLLFVKKRASNDVCDKASNSILPFYFCRETKKSVHIFYATQTKQNTMPSRFADQDDDTQQQLHLPRPIDRLTPLPDFVLSYHNPPDEFGTNSNSSHSMSAPRLRRSNSNTSTTTTTSSPDETETSSEGFQYQSVRRVKTEPSAPMSSGSSDEIRAMSDGMFEILKYKIKDLGNVMQRVQNVLPEDMEPAGEEELLNLALEYLQMSDHDGPSSSKKMQSAMLRKVDSLGKLAKRLHVEIPANVDRNSDMYDLRSYYRGHRGVDIYAEASGGRKKKEKKKDNVDSSEFQQALAALDPTEFYPDGNRGNSLSTTGMEESLDYEETISKEDGSSSLTRRGMGASTRSSAAGALTVARQNLVRMQDDKRRRTTNRRTKKMRDQRNLLNKIAESFSIRALPNLSLEYKFGQMPPTEIDSELILGYIADSMRIVEGSHSERVFRNYFTALISRRAFSLLFWQIYLIHFQNKAKNNAPVEAKSAEMRQKLLKERDLDIVSQGKELKKLQELLAATYVQLLSSVKVETHKPVFYRYYSAGLSEAIYQTLYFYFPGSRNLYNNKFKRQLYIEVAETLSGMPIYPVSAAIMSASVFGHSIITDNDLTSKKKTSNQEENSFGGSLPAGYSTKPRRFHDPSIWIPTGKRAPRLKGRATHVSPLVRHFLGKPVGELLPLPTKRSKPTTTRYRLPNAFKMLGKAEDRMLELRANYNFKMNQFSMGKRYDRKTTKTETNELEKEKQRVLFSNASDRQRYAFKILDQHKKAAAKKRRQADLSRR